MPALPGAGRSLRMEEVMASLKLTVNGSQHTVDVDPSVPLRNISTDSARDSPRALALPLAAQIVRICGCRLRAVK